MLRLFVGKGCGHGSFRQDSGPESPGLRCPPASFRGVRTKFAATRTIVGVLPTDFASFSRSMLASPMIAQTETCRQMLGITRPLVSSPQRQRRHLAAKPCTTCRYKPNNGPKYLHARRKMQGGRVILGISGHDAILPAATRADALAGPAVMWWAA